MSKDQRYYEARKVTLIGAFVNAMLGVLKLAGGFIFHSHALIADGFHSLSDLLTDAMVVFAAKYGRVDADETHPYGHQRIETAATLMLSILLGMAGASIAWDAIDEVIKHAHTMPNFIALPIAIFSIIANELSFQYTKHIGHKINSPLILANAWHHRSDALASIVVALGIAASLMGYQSFDAIAAIIVGYLIIKMGWDYGWNSIKELVDTAVDADTLKKIQETIEQIPGVIKIHQLRSRFMGNEIYIDVHVLVLPKISVSEGHYIAQHVHTKVMEKIEKVQDVVVHIDPEDDEISMPCHTLPNRPFIEHNIINPIRAQYPDIQHVIYHFLNGEVLVECYISKISTKQIDMIKSALISDFQKQNFPIRLLNLLIIHP